MMMSIGILYTDECGVWEGRGTQECPLIVAKKEFCAVCFVDNELLLLFNCAFLAVFLSISKVSLQKSVFEYMYVSVC